MTHEQKKKLARKMITPGEIKDGVPIFQSNAWMHRREAQGRKPGGIPTAYHRIKEELKEIKIGWWMRLKAWIRKIFV